MPHQERSCRILRKPNRGSAGKYQASARSVGPQDGLACRQQQHVRQGGASAHSNSTRRQRTRSSRSRASPMSRRRWRPISSKTFPASHACCHPVSVSTAWVGHSSPTRASGLSVSPTRWIKRPASNHLAPEGPGGGQVRRLPGKIALHGKIGASEIFLEGTMERYTPRTPAPGEARCALA